MNMYSHSIQLPAAVIVQLYPGLRAESRSLRAFKQKPTSLHIFIFCIHNALSGKTQSLDTTKIPLHFPHSPYKSLIS